MRDDTAYLHHMVDAISTIARYLDGVTAEGFHADTMLQRIALQDFVEPSVLIPR